MILPTIAIEKVLADGRLGPVGELVLPDGVRLQMEGQLPSALVELLFGRGAVNEPAVEPGAAVVLVIVAEVERRGVHGAGVGGGPVAEAAPKAVACAAQIVPAHAFAAQGQSLAF